MSADLSDDAVGRALRGAFGRVRRVRDVVASTNAEALQWAAEGAPPGAVVIADYQERGRGRWGRQWLAEPGRALLFSVVIGPAVGPALTTTAAGVAVAESLERCSGHATSLRWPNDVLLGERKVCGILTESRLVPGGPAAAVVGIGINVRAQPSLSGDFAVSATSIEDEVALTGRGTVPDRPALLADVLVALEAWVGLLTDAQGRAEVVGRAWARSTVIGRDVVVRLADGSRARGMAVGLSAGGELRLRTSAGEVTLASGEVERLGSAP